MFFIIASITVGVSLFNNSLRIGSSSNYMRVAIETELASNFKTYFIR